MITYMKGIYVCVGCGKKLEVTEKVTELPKCNHCGSQVYSKEMKDKPGEFEKTR